MTFGDDFQRLSKYSRHTLKGRSLDWENKPPLYKKDPDAELFKLSEPDRKGGQPLYGILQQRRSVRNYSSAAAAAEKNLSQILWATQGITSSTAHHQFRAAPSAGGLFPIETYCAINKVEGFKPGIYHYQVPYHALALVKEGAFGLDLAQAALGQKMLRDADFNLVWTAMIERSKWKYEQRAYRYIYLDAGHLAQNAALAAVSCGLGSCQIGAFFDEEANQVIGVDGEWEFVIYMSSFGKPA